MILEHWSKKFEMIHISNNNQFAEHLINEKNNWLTWRKLKKKNTKKETENRGERREDRQNTTTSMLIKHLKINWEISNRNFKYKITNINNK